MPRFQAMFAALLFLAESAAAQSPPEPGIRSMAIAAPARGENVYVTLWYPARDGGTAETYGESKIFAGVPARRDAAFADGAFSLILMSHGGLRANPTMAG